MLPPTTTGAAGTPGAALISTLEDATDVHPSALVTVNVWFPGARLGTV